MLIQLILSQKLPSSQTYTVIPTWFSSIIELKEIEKERLMFGKRSFYNNV